MYNGRRAGLDHAGAGCITCVVLILAGHTVEELRVGGEYAAMVACMVGEADAIGAELGMQTIESTCRGVENCGLEVTGLLLCSDEEGVILDVIAQEVHNLQ